jgi:serine/threonine protein phosphatase PrpC
MRSHGADHGMGFAVTALVIAARAQGRTYVGRRRKNEDSFWIAAETGLFAVADGMGGYEGGEVASFTAIESLARVVERSDRSGFHSDDGTGKSVGRARLELAIRQASHEVERRRLGPLRDMGSTLAVLLVGPRAGIVAHVGDSRVYRCRDSEIELLTNDHAIVQGHYALRLGTTSHRQGTTQATRAVTRAIGVPGASQPDVIEVDIAPGDRFVLCTDGLTDALDAQQIAEIVSTETLSAAPTTLVERAYALGSLDNITAVVVHF